MFVRSLKSLLLAAACVLASQAHVSAQAGRRLPSPAPLPAPTPAPPLPPTPVDTTNFERVRLVVSRGLDNFVRDLNAQGRLSYRVERSVSYGDKDERRNYAAVLRLDPGHTYDYVHDRMPPNVLYGHPLNHHARRGYVLLDTYPLTQCPPEKSYDPDDPETWPALRMLGTVRGNAFLFMRRDGAAEQTREYMLIRGYVGTGWNQNGDLEKALEAPPPGFRPVRLIFSMQGRFSFLAAVIFERDAEMTAPVKVGYQIIKEKKNLEQEINQLADEGARLIGAGHIGSAKVALLAQQKQSAGDYVFLDDDKYAKELDKLIASGYSYKGLLAGDLTCEETDVVSQKLVFAREAAAGPSRQYKILRLPEPKRGAPTPPALSELQRLAREDFHIRDLFYARGLNVILEK